MTDLKETLADVAAMVPRYSWEIMDEQQRDELMAKIVLPRYRKTTADGVKLGPSAWAKMLGASAKAVESRVYRLKQSQKAVAANPARTLSPERTRHVRSGLREADSEDIARILESDPKIALKVAKAAQQVERAAVERTRQTQRQRSPELVHRAEFNEVAGALLRMKRLYASTLNEVRDLELDADEAEALDEQIDGIGVITDWFHSFLRSGSQGFEQDLENLLAEGR